MLDKATVLLALLVIATCLGGQARADVFVDTKQSCMKDCTGPCCDERCSYAACVAQVMTVEQQGVEMNDPGAWGAALATCATQSQRIRQCSERYIEQRNREAAAVIVQAVTSPDPRRVGERYTFTLAIENRGARPVEVHSVGAQTTVDGVAGQASPDFFNPERHRGKGWLTSTAPPGRRTVIYRSSGTADRVGVWTTRLVFHTNLGDFEVQSSSTVVR